MPKNSYKLSLEAGLYLKPLLFATHLHLVSEPVPYHFKRLRALAADRPL